MGQTKVVSHLVGDRGGEAYRAVVVVLQEKSTTLALNSADCLIKHQNSGKFPEDECEEVVRPG